MESNSKLPVAVARYAKDTKYIYYICVCVCVCVCRVPSEYHYIVLHVPLDSFFAQQRYSLGLARLELARLG